MVTGLLFILCAETDMYRFGVGGTPIPFYDPPKILVRKGVYSCTKNPIYLGTTLEYIGIGFIRSEPLIIIFSLLLLIAAMTLYIISMGFIILERTLERNLRSIS